MNKTDLLAVMLFSAAGIMIRYRTIGKMIPALIFACILMTCAFTDLNMRLIHDKLLAAGACLKLISIPLQTDMANALAGMIFGAAVLFLLIFPVSLAYEMVRKRSSIGGGDIKLLVLTGAWLGPGDGLAALFLGCLISLILMPQNNRERQFPWGPQIALGAYFVMIFG